jgi:iron complex outermembrane receptor protein
MNHFLIKGGALLCTTASFLSAQTDHSEAVHQLDDYVVSAGPLARPVEDFASPFTSLDREAIRRENGGNLGQLLDGQPGVSATSFGGGASRPIIRGFDGPRIRILESGLGSLDVSETSPDHAVSIEPLLTDRVEILRGPSTLLYGSSAIGGVVNVIGKEIPREPVDPKGYEGAFETRYDTVSEGETYLGYGTVGGEKWALSVSGLTREAENYEIPGEDEVFHDEDEEEEEEHHDEEESGDTLNNSFVENDYLSVGGTWFFGEQNYIGASFSQYESFYGVPGHAHHEEEEEEEEHHEEHADDGVAIDLERKRFDIELALFDVTDWIEAVRVRFGYTDYEHTEGELGHEEEEEDEEEHEEHEPTIFSREGWELRAEAAHNEWAFIDSGVFGIQVSDTDFEAIGDEGAAFGPPTETRDQAIFISEHIHNGAWHYEFGGRLEARQIDADGADDYDDVALSLAAGFVYNIDDSSSLALSLQRSQRHPTSSELYADGAHLATRQYEVGDPDLDLETNYGIDLSYRYNSEKWESKLSVFYIHCDDHIYATATGADEDELPVFAYGAADASFWGFEAELEHLLVDTNDVQVRIGLLTDYVQAENRDDDEDMPRIPPLRIGGRLRAFYGNWDAGLLLRHAFEQNDTAPLETETDGYTELKADLGYTFDLDNGVDLTLFARADNLLDEDIRHHTSFLKDLAPLPGRNFTLGARLTF